MSLIYSKGPADSTSTIAAFCPSTLNWRLSWELWVVTVVLCFLFGCSSKQISLSSEALSFHEKALNAESLLKLKIEHGGEEKFSGILVIQRNEDLTRMVLLDPTGIKLIEENVSSNGDIQMVSVVAQLQKSRLPDYIGKAIHRIYYSFPSSNSCYGPINRFCWSEEKAAFIEKKSLFGPFLLWSVTYNKLADDQLTNITISEPWSDVRFILQPL